MFSNGVRFFNIVLVPEDFEPGDPHPDESTCDEGDVDSPASVETLSELSTAT
jgi:hypothetical protein